jgi:hypothetical protein
LKESENFFDAGFTSMSLLQLSGVLTAELGREVSALDLFGNPNLAALATALFGGEGAVPPQGHTPSAPAMKARLVRMRADRERLTNQARSEGEL